MKSNFSAPSAPGHPQILVVPHLDNQLAARAAQSAPFGEASASRWLRPGPQ